jgi:hypothetical protein
MAATPESKARTRAFTRVIGPWLALAPGIIVVRTPDIGVLANAFFENANALFVWFARALLLFSGLMIIAFHQYWSSVAAVMISLLGWLLALRGLVLMAAPQLIERAAASMDALPLSCGQISAPSFWSASISPMWAGSPSPPRQSQRTAYEQDCRSEMLARIDAHG